MSWIAYNRLIEISDLNFDLTIRARDRTQVAYMAVTAYPNSRSSRNRAGCVPRVEPFVELDRVTANVGVSRFGHF